MANRKKPKASKRGRPPLPDALRRSKMLGFHLPAADRETLVEAARANEQSISAELRYRIMRSLRDDEVLAELRAIRAMLTEGR